MTKYYLNWSNFESSSRSFFLIYSLNIIMTKYYLNWSNFESSSRSFELAKW